MCTDSNYLYFYLSDIAVVRSVATIVNYTQNPYAINFEK